MIKIIEKDAAFPAWDCFDAFSARITALFNTYGVQNFAVFWYQQSDEKITAVVSRVDGSMTVSAAADADYEELAEFIEVLGFSTLTCDKKVADLMGIEVTKTSYIAEYKGSDYSCDCDSSADMRGVYALLCESGFDMGDYESFLADFCARLNKGSARIAVIHSNGEISASASALFIGKNSVLIGAVATKEDMRGKGLAGSLVKTLASKFEGKRVYVFCRNNSLMDFYGKNGFVQVGDWAICERKNNG